MKNYTVKDNLTGVRQKLAGLMPANGFGGGRSGRFSGALVEDDIA